MSQPEGRIHRLVLTGGPCAGKTTGQNRIAEFFENLGWRVFRAPEAAGLIMQGGVRFYALTPAEVLVFQENVVKTMMTIEDFYVAMARTSATTTRATPTSGSRDCLLICDRGVMDAAAFVDAADWESICRINGWSEFELRDHRYDQVVHLVSAANGAEDFYSNETNSIREEGIELAREVDARAQAAWLGHPRLDVVDNSTGFEDKMNRLVGVVCRRLGLDVGDRLRVESKKRKFLVNHREEPGTDKATDRLPDDHANDRKDKHDEGSSSDRISSTSNFPSASFPPDELFPAFEDFDVVHDYLATSSSTSQARVRRRGQRGTWTYTHTIRAHPDRGADSPEVRRHLSAKQYAILLAERDLRHCSIFKRRRCFIWKNQYFQLDLFVEPSPSRCRGLMILESFTSNQSQTFRQILPDFLVVADEITDDPEFSMFNLSKVE